MTVPESAIVYCAEHPEVVTGLRCSRCEKPICPRCLVQTPVGARCRSCAQLRRLPTFEVGTAVFLRAAAGGLAAAVVAGVIWWMLPIGGFLSFLLSPLAGYGVGEAVSRAANRRRSRWLKVLAVAGVLVAYFIARSPLLDILPVLFTAAGGAMLGAAAGALIGTLLNPIAWLVIAIGAYIATTRIDA